jgi:hypothetical protein
MALGTWNIEEALFVLVPKLQCPYGCFVDAPRLRIRPPGANKEARRGPWA